jgi:hypothetical protein
MTDGRRTAASSLRALAATRAAARDQADELLLHVPVVGDLGVQRLLDGWVEQAADTLRAVSEAAEERLLELGRSSEPYAGTPPARDAAPTGVPPASPRHGAGR